MQPHLVALMAASDDDDAAQAPLTRVRTTTHTHTFLFHRRASCTKCRCRPHRPRSCSPHLAMALCAAMTCAARTAWARCCSHHPHGMALPPHKFIGHTWATLPPRPPTPPHPTHSHGYPPKTAQPSCSVCISVYHSRLSYQLYLGPNTLLRTPPTPTTPTTPPTARTPALAPAAPAPCAPSTPCTWIRQANPTSS